MTQRTSNPFPIIVLTLPSAVEALWIAALLAAYGSTAEVRLHGRTSFLHCAQWAFYGLLCRTTGPRVSLSFLQRITARAAARMLERWAQYPCGPLASFLGQMQCALDDVMFGQGEASANVDSTSAGGVLTTLTRDDQRMLIDRVRGRLAPNVLTELMIRVETGGASDTSTGHTSPALQQAVCDLEWALLGGISYELGLPIHEERAMRAA
ncbi:MAG: hypothetical protein IBJ19_00785 [Gemmatimonadaceae bacterium]|nr:hypothetical protein [Gemmatimonadaceae bacterium]